MKIILIQLISFLALVGAVIGIMLVLIGYAPAIVIRIKTVLYYIRQFFS
jgi:hypothetical protein